MLAKLKLVAYIILLPLAVWFAWGFHENYKLVLMLSEEDGAPHPRRPAAMTSTNGPDLSTNTTQTATNLVVKTTNVPDASNASSPATLSTNTTAKRPIILVHRSNEETIGEARAAMPRDLVCLILCAAALGVMIAYDTMSYFAHHGVDMLLDDDNDAVKRDSDYEHAEQAWAEGHPMEAIQLMRDYLKKNPRKQFVALRIAEIYEKDFNNPLAAALEYEEVLKHKLAPERWGWAAIHLCNLYGKLDRNDNRTQLLERIINEYPKTAAARKARATLGVLEVEASDPAPQPKPELRIKKPQPEEDPPSNLPKGFRPK